MLLRVGLSVMVSLAALLFVGSAGSSACAANAALRQQATAAMKQAAKYYTDQIAYRGGYVYYYSPDLKQRLGEGVASPQQIWVQPPGTPTVGLAYLKAYQATGDSFYLDTATQAAEALIYGQLKSGAWTNAVDFDPRGSHVANYRNGKGRGRNFSTLDDNISQSAIRFLMHADKAHNFQHKEIHESVCIATDALLAAQFPCGAFPQGWDEEPAPRSEGKRANYPDYDWRTEGRIKNYWDMYTLNDGLAGDVTALLIDAHEIYQDSRYMTALKRLGDFLILAQMPQPQPAWSQQYNYDMLPIWARRFEPAAIAGRESQDVLESLLAIYQQTGDMKYLEPVPAALKYLQSSLLSDGQLARYYELKSNKPLYMFRRGKEYTLTYDDSRLPSHYGWKTESRLKQIQADYQALKSGGAGGQGGELTDAQLEKRSKEILGQLDGSNRWVSTYRNEPLVGQPKFRPGQQYINSGIFSQNLELLSEYLERTK